ncbi:hypothetical protein [Ktedonospora formicarum]|uniref:Uncharacterized protein n=1 Tax=Ktedonospora formicarum TaxID=2778364 RepID=A0A8J3I836_9CHLR|nr:hypothetical protein [Ktedonospora formicarum]GHO48570.1 hypothetical protein KSX_67330 [Ktedonospora formicarum]
MLHPFSHSTLFVLLVREGSTQQLFEELQDHIHIEASQAARIIYSGVSKRRHEGVIWLLVKQEATTFRQRVKRILERDEDVFAYQEVPLSHLWEAIERVPWNRKNQDEKEGQETPLEGS